MAFFEIVSRGLFSVATNFGNVDRSTVPFRLKFHYFNRTLFIKKEQKFFKTTWCSKLFFLMPLKVITRYSQITTLLSIVSSWLLSLSGETTFRNFQYATVKPTCACNTFAYVMVF